MKLKNANIKSKEEALHRMLDGEVFYYNTVKLYYSKELFEGLNSLFIAEHKDGYRDELLGLLDTYHLFEIEHNWEDDLRDENILCFVWDRSELRYASIVCEKQDGQYLTDHGCRWKFATPVTKEDLWNKGE